MSAHPHVPEPAGDPAAAGADVPDALARLLRGDPAVFAERAVFAHASPTDDLRWSASIARGSRDAAAALPRAPVEPIVWAHDGDRSFAEGRSGDETVLLSAQTDGRGAVRRALRLACAPLDPPVAHDGEGGRWPDARPVIETYLAHLRAAEFESAVGFFSPDCLYSHPPYRDGMGRVVYRGHDELLHGFVHDRGPSPVVQIVEAFVQRGPHALLEGVVEGIPNGGTFAASCSIDRDGRLSRYVAFYAATRVERADDPA
jgi:hypothetical protein